MKKTSTRPLEARDGESERFCAWIVASVITYPRVAASQPLLSFPYGSVPLFFLLGMGLAAANRLRPSSKSNQIHRGSIQAQKVSK